MNCPRCNKPNPDEKQYCGDCGAPLKDIGGMSEADLKERIRAVIKEELKDSKVVESEATEKVVDRIAGWAKLVGFYAGIPLGIALIILGALGVTKSTDLWILFDTAQKQVQSKIDSANIRIKSAEDQANQVVKKTEELKTLEGKIDSQIAVSGKLDKRVSQIQGQVQGISELLQRRPGVERWPVKTGSDPDCHLVNLTPVRTTVEDLVKLARPDDIQPSQNQHFSGYQNARAKPVEVTAYSVEAWIVEVRWAADGDYELVLESDSGENMIVAIPDPNPPFTNANSCLAPQIKHARQEVDKELNPQKQVYIPHTARVRVSGVGFFDPIHGQIGRSRTGIELHPVIGIEFTEGP
jgi:hypothetical protein